MGKKIHFSVTVLVTAINVSCLNSRISKYHVFTTIIYVLLNPCLVLVGQGFSPEIGSGTQVSFDVAIVINARHPDASWEGKGTSEKNHQLLSGQLKCPITLVYIPLVSHITVAQCKQSWEVKGLKIGIEMVWENWRICFPCHLRSICVT